MGANDVFVASLAVSSSDGLILAIGVLCKWHFGYEITLSGLSIPAAVERDVQILTRRVEAVGDGRHVCRER